MAFKAQNLGPKSTEWLAKAGITTVDELRSRGSVEAFLDVEELGIKPSLNLLYALEGAMSDRHWQAVRREEGGELLLRLDMAREARQTQGG